MIPQAPRKRDDDDDSIAAITLRQLRAMAEKKWRPLPPLRYTSLPAGWSQPEAWHSFTFDIEQGTDDWHRTGNQIMVHAIHMSMVFQPVFQPISHATSFDIEWIIVVNKATNGNAINWNDVWDDNSLLIPGQRNFTRQHAVTVLAHGVEHITCTAVVNKGSDWGDVYDAPPMQRWSIFPDVMVTYFDPENQFDVPVAYNDIWFGCVTTAGRETQIELHSENVLEFYDM